MPSANLNLDVVGRSLTAFGPKSYRPDDPLISMFSAQAIGDEINASNFQNLFSGTYPASSRVIAVPFVVSDQYLVRKVWWVNGTTATTDSVDVGVYNEAGTTLLVSGGSTAVATANVVQEKDCTDTLLPPGRYWLAYIQGGVTFTPLMLQPFAVAQTRWWGVAQQAGSGSTLGSTFTPAACASAMIPYCGIANRTQVA